MYKVTKYPHGAFSWADNSSTDAEATGAFYMALFGWDKQEVPIGENITYTMFQLEGENVAALNQMMPEMQEQGIPSHWANYVSVDDVDALVDVVTDSGGAIAAGPLDVFDSGRVLYIQDPTGGRLGLWQPKNHIGAGLVNKPGAMLWNELITGDVETAKSFYGKTLGWEFYGGDDGYIHIKNRGRSNGGMIQMDDVPTGWTPYFSVAGIDESIAKAGELGGQIMVPKTEAPGAGHFAMILDPAGACFYIMQAYQLEPWQE